MSNFKNRDPNIPKEILDMMPPADQAPPSHEPVKGAAEFYRGYLVGDNGNAVNPFACRDKRNSKRTNPRPGAAVGWRRDDEPWGF